MKLLTKQIETKLINNFKYNKNRERPKDFDPVLKLFNPVGAATWLITEYDPENDVFFGLCDLGMGFPELGYVSKTELESIRLMGGHLGIERDMHWEAEKTLSEYCNDALVQGRIVC